MAIGNVFKISKKTAKGYNVPEGRPLSRNGAGVTAIMGLTNGIGAAERARRSKRALKQCRGDDGKFVSCFARNGGVVSPNRSKGRKPGSGRQRARRNEGVEPMIVMEAPESYQENRRRGGKRRGKKSSKRYGKRGHKMARIVMLSASKRGIGVRMRRNEGLEEESTSELSELIANRRGRGRKAKRRGSKKGRKSYGRWSRSAARRTRKSSRRSYGRGRKSARRGRKSSRRSYSRKARSFKGIRRVKASRSGRGLTVMLRNSFSTNPTPASMHRAHRMAGHGVAMSGHRGVRPMHPMMGGGLNARLYPPWARRQMAEKARAKAMRAARKAQRLGMAMPAMMRGLTGRDLKMAKQAMSKQHLMSLFPDFASYRAWVKAMKGGKTFRSWSSKVAARRGKGRRRRFGSKRRRFGSKRRHGRGRRRAGRWSRSLRRGRGRRRSSGRRRRFGSKRRHGRGRRRAGRWSRSLRGRKSRRRMRRNGFMANMPFASTKELLIGGLLGIGTFGLITYGSNWIAAKSPLAGTAARLILGAAAAFASDRVFSNDAYAKSVAVAGIISLGLTAVSALVGALAPKQAAAGFGAIGYRGTGPRYNQMGAYYQAQAGMGAFQQAMAGSPFLQAQAGYGDYFQPMQGTGEYVSNDGSVSAVSDFGEYVAQNLQVEGYGDYEVMPQYTPGADGMGYVSDGVRPDSNMDREFDIIEAAAGLGASPAPRSDYIPSGQSSTVGAQESSEYSGVFDVGGPNGVFG